VELVGILRILVSIRCRNVSEEVGVVMVAEMG